MSDTFNQLPWRRWALDDLAGAMVSPFVIHEPETQISEQHQQQMALELLREKTLAEARSAGFEEGRRAGFQQGHDAGQIAGQQEGQDMILEQQQPLIARLQMLIGEFEHSLDAIDSVITDRLAQVALSAARQIIGGEPADGGAALIAQIRQLLQQEPAFSGKPLLRVHPTMMPVIEQQLGATLNLYGWRLQADSELHPAGCTLSAPEGSKDASIATRWHELCRLAAPGAC